MSKTQKSKQLPQLEYSMEDGVDLYDEITELLKISKAISPKHKQYAARIRRIVEKMQIYHMLRTMGKLMCYICVDCPKCGTGADHLGVDDLHSHHYWRCPRKQCKYQWITPTVPYNMTD